MKQIAIQGIRGSFHDIAAHQYFQGEDIQLVCCDTFEQIFREMRDDYARLGLMAIENTIAGSLLHNYDLLRESGMTVIGEHKLHIGTPSPRSTRTLWRWRSAAAFSSSTPP